MTEGLSWAYCSNSCMNLRLWGRKQGPEKLSKVIPTNALATITACRYQAFEKGLVQIETSCKDKIHTRFLRLDTKKKNVKYLIHYFYINCMLK